MSTSNRVKEVHLCQMMENQTDAASAFVSAAARLTQMNRSSNSQDRNINKPFLRLVKEKMFET